jgi:hypothetical protein
MADRRSLPRELVMRPWCLATPLVVFGLFGGGRARADGPPVAVGASVGWAAPLGSAERGGRLRDTTFGTVPLGLDASYRVLSSVGVAAHVTYGIGVPTLCQTTGDCTASLGTDVLAILGIRWHLPRLGPTSPLVDLGVGYEWFAARFADAGAHSARSYRGPVLTSGRLAAPFRAGAHWTLGPVVELSVGTFTARSLQTNVSSISQDVASRAVHGWLQLGVRLAFVPSEPVR